MTASQCAKKRSSLSGPARDTLGHGGSPDTYTFFGVSRLDYFLGLVGNPGFLSGTDLPTTLDTAEFTSGVFSLIDTNASETFLSSDVTSFTIAVVPSVPVPASLPLALLALGGFGWMRKRQIATQSVQRAV